MAQEGSICFSLTRQKERDVMLSRGVKRRELLIDISSYQKANRSKLRATHNITNKPNYIWLILALISGICCLTMGLDKVKTLASSISSDGSVEVMIWPNPDLKPPFSRSETMVAPVAPPKLEPVAELPEKIKPVLPQGTFLVVNKTMFTLSLYQNGQKMETYSAGLGKKQPKTETPTGQFKVISRAVDPPLKQDASTETIPGGDSKNPLGPRWLGLNTGINVPNSIGIHGTTEGASVGRPQTDGCVQLNNSAIRTLYEQVRLGTPVWIGTTDQLTDWGI